MPTHAHPCPPMPCAGSQGPTGLRVVPLQLTGLRVGCCRCRAPHHTPRGWEHPLYLLVARKLGAPTHPRPTRVALLLTDCACAQRGADSGARIILPAGLFLAVRHLVRNSPSSPRHRCAIRPRASVRACSCSCVARVVLGWVGLGWVGQSSSGGGWFPPMDRAAGNRPLPTPPGCVAVPSRARIGVGAALARCGLA